MPGQEYRPISAAIIEAVADAEGVAPADLEPPLGHVIDPDGLDVLFQDVGPEDVTSASPTVTFEYCDHEVMIWGTGQVTID